MDYWDVLDAKTHNPVSPRQYTTGKSQDSVIKEIIDKFAEEYDGETKKIVMKGGVGSGKSLIALNLARFFNKATIVVPRKILQEQYLEDYYAENRKLVVMKDGEELKITTYKGKANFPCLYESTTADDVKIPCNRPLEKGERRIDVGSECEYWSPLYSTHSMTEETIASLSMTHEEEVYPTARGDVKSHFVSRCGMCPYYAQFKHLQEADAIIVNNKKFLIELMLDRMPKSEILIIDELDFFLDELNSKYTFSLSYIRKKLEQIQQNYPKAKAESFIEAIDDYENDAKQYKLSQYQKTDVMLLQKHFTTQQFLKLFAEQGSTLPGLENVSRNAQLFLRYANDAVFEIANKPSYSYQNDDSLDINFTLLNFKELMKEILSHYKYFVGMSGTIHQSQDILNEMYGLDDVTYIKSEKDISGTLKLLKYKTTMPYSYMNMKQNRETFLYSLNDIIGKCKSKGQTLIHVKSFETDCLRGNEDEHLYPHIVTAKSLRATQQADVKNEELERFKNKEVPVLFSTKYYRGVDLPDDQCRFIIIPRVPFEAKHDIYWKGLEMKYQALGQGHFFTSMYIDKMIRELTQAVARGLRHPDDLVHVVYIDSRLEGYLKRISTLTLD